MRKILLIAAMAVCLCAGTALAFFGQFSLKFGNTSTSGGYIDLLPSLSWSPTFHNYSSRDTGTATNQSFTLSNTGNDTAEDVTISATGTSFRLYSTTTFGNLSAGRTRVAKVQFKPLTASTFTGYLNYSAPNIARTTANLSGRGTSTGTWVIDDFNRVDATTLGSNWTDNAGGLQIVSGKAKNVGGALPISLWAANTIGADQCSQITFEDAVADVGGRAYIRRPNVATHNGYYLTASAVAMTLYRQDAQFSSTSLGFISHTLANGNVGMVCAQGSTLTLRINGVIRLTVTDATYSSGTVGIVIPPTNGTIAAWAGGDIGAMP